MAKTSRKQRSLRKPLNRTQKYWRFRYRKKRVKISIDRVLFLRFLRKIHGRFWGITAIIGMLVGFGVCFFIKPEMLAVNTTFSEFGSDIRTAPYFSGSVFFAAYGMWKWRRYLSRTWKRTMPVTGLLMLTVVGLYLIALMPLEWRPVPHYIHIVGVILAGVSMFATVVLDGMLSKTWTGYKSVYWQMWRIVSILSIILGGWLTLGSSDLLGRYDVGLIGESLMLLGYFIWILIKTYKGEGQRTMLSRLLKDLVLVS